MYLFQCTYEYWTRPRGRKGRKAIQTITFQADDLYQALGMAKHHAQHIFYRRRWKLLGCVPTTGTIPNGRLG